MKHFIAIIVAMFSLSAQAVDFDLGMGQTQFSRTDDGIYWQQGPQDYFAHTLNLKSNSYDIGLSGMANSWMRWRVGYKYLGGVTTQAQATTDETYVPGGAGCVPTGCDPTWQFSTFTTQSSVQGFPLTLEPEINIGPFKLIGIVGLYVYQAEIKIQAYRCYTCMQATDTYRMEKVDVGPTFGFGVQNKNTQLRMTWYSVDIAGTHRNGIVPNFQPGLKTINLTLMTRF